MFTKFGQKSIKFKTTHIQFYKYNKQDMNEYI